MFYHDSDIFIIDISLLNHNEYKIWVCYNLAGITILKLMTTKNFYLMLGLPQNEEKNFKVLLFIIVILNTKGN